MKQNMKRVSKNILFINTEKMDVMNWVDVDRITNNYSLN
jgi:hypothetical protein